MAKLTVEIEGLPRLVERLAPRRLYWAVMKQALDELGAAAEAAARSNAGSFAQTGALAAGMTHKVNSIPVPLWVAVSNTTATTKGSRYPFILEFGARWGHKNWLLSAVRRVQSGAGRVAGSAASKIEANWRG